MSLSGQMLEVGKKYLAANLKTSYVQGLINGTLSQEQKDYYNVQDISFEYNEVGIIAALQRYATSSEEAMVFNRRMDLQITTINQWLQRNVHPAPRTWEELVAVEIQPINKLYQQHMAATISSHQVLQILPSFYAGEWLYITMGQQLQIPNSAIAAPNPQFLGEKGFLNEFAKFIDQEAVKATSDDRQRALTTFQQSCLFECYFWEAATRQDNWDDWETRALSGHYDHFFG